MNHRHRRFSAGRKAVRKRPLPGEGRGPEPQMPEKSINWPDLPGPSGNIQWGNTDRKAKIYPTSKGL